MIKKQEIEKMAQFIHGRRDKNGSYKTAEALVNAGYGEIEPTVRELRKQIGALTVYEAGSTGIECVSLNDIDNFIEKFLNEGAQIK